MPTTPNMLKPMQQFIEPQSPLNNKMLQQSSQAQQQTLMMNQSHSQSKDRRVKWTVTMTFSHQ
jgi:hypothetical protein